MNNPIPPENPTSQSAPPEQTLQSPLRCLTGAMISGAMALALYSLTASIASAFAAKPVHSGNPAVVNIAVAVRTLVVGMTALGTGIFGLVAIGLVALAVQIMVTRGSRE